MLSLLELGRLLDAEVDASARPGRENGTAIAAVSGIAGAAADSLVFAEDAVSFAAALSSAAGAVLVSPETAAGGERPGKPLLLCAQPRLAFARAARLLALSLPAAADRPAVHPSASIASTAQLAADVTIGAYAVLEDGVHLGEGSSIGSGAVLGKGVTVGCHCRIYPRAVLYPGTVLGDRVVVHAGAVLGADGFGYVRDAQSGEYIQFPQQGTLMIEDDVEIGANTTIDRGALEETRVARGAKIDNLVHIGHNVKVGRHAVIAAQTGISGSSTIGDGAVLGGQVGIGDHAGVGDGVILGGQAGVLPHKELRGPGILFWGTPAQPVKRYLRQLGALARLGRPREAGPARARETSAAPESPRR